ncbi:hypothetical protein U2A404270045 [Corynebacterium striatum]|nr:hypothetical protein U2A404270045 [Corynebacterium striatum]
MVVDYLSSQPNRAGYQVSTKRGSGPSIWRIALAVHRDNSYPGKLGYRSTGISLIPNTPSA